MTVPESGPQFACRYWGGPYAVLDEVGNGWSFSSDGFRYRVFESDNGWWQMECHDGAYARFRLHDPYTWRIEIMRDAQPRFSTRHPAR